MEKVNFTVFDNGAGFWLQANGQPVVMFSSLGDLWRHIRALVRVGYHSFTVGKNQIDAIEWVENAERMGLLD